MNNLLPKDRISNEFWNENVVFLLMKRHKYCVNYLIIKKSSMIFWIMCTKEGLLLCKHFSFLCPSCSSVGFCAVDLENFKRLFVLSFRCNFLFLFLIFIINKATPRSAEVCQEERKWQPGWSSGVCFSELVWSR